MGTVLVILGLCLAHVTDRAVLRHARRRRGGHVHCPSRSRLPRAAAASAAMALLRRGRPAAEASALSAAHGREDVVSVVAVEGEDVDAELGRCGRLRRRST